MNSSQNINPEANGYHSPHYGHRNHIAYSPTLDYMKQPRVNLTKSSMLLCHHKLFCRRACQILRGRGCQGKQYRESRNGDTTDR